MSQYLKVFSLFTLCTVLLITSYGCGFKLRSAGGMPAELKTLILQPQNNTAFFRLLKRSLTVNQVTILSQSEAPVAVLNLHEQSFNERIVSFAPDGKANQKELNFKIIFSLKKKDGSLAFDREEITLSRIFSIDPRNKLGLESEERTIQEELRLDTIAALLQRLQAL